MWEPIRDADIPFDAGVHVSLQAATAMRALGLKGKRFRQIWQASQLSGNLWAQVLLLCCSQLVPALWCHTSCGRWRSTAPWLLAASHTSLRNGGVAPPTQTELVTEAIDGEMTQFVIVAKGAPKFSRRGPLPSGDQAPPSTPVAGDVVHASPSTPAEGDVVDTPPASTPDQPDESDASCSPD